MNEPLYIGAIDARGTASGFANVTMDEASIYNSVLSATDVTAHYNAIPIPEPAALAIAGLGGVALLGRRRSLA